VSFLNELRRLGRGDNSHALMADAGFRDETNRSCGDQGLDAAANADIPVVAVPLHDIDAKQMFQHIRKYPVLPIAGSCPP